MKPNVFSEIRSACRTVAERARHVQIRVDRINEYAASLPITNAIAPTLDTASHYVGEPRDMLAFFLTLDSINFGSGYFPHLKKRPGMSGYFTIASSLTDHFREHGPIPPHQLADLSADDCASMFGQDRADPAVAELMLLFRTALNDLGRLVVERCGGLFTQLVESANHSAQQLAPLLREMRFFRGVERTGEYVV